VGGYYADGRRRHDRNVRALARDLLRYPHLATDTKWALKGELAGVYRVKQGRRFRVLYIFSKRKMLLVILFMGERKDGDKHDVYEHFKRLLRRGVFDPQLQEVGLSKPPV
jgi:mRNA-degrading endonuclease RelE of RelBE toxin-antitoxin system